MRRALVPLLLLALLLAPCARAAKHPEHSTAAQPSQPEKCFPIRGRAILYRGDGFFAIWHVGTHHIFYPADKASADLLCDYMDCTSPRRQPALFADMTVCPTEPYKKGWAQPVVVKSVTHSYVVPDWPPPGRK
jgi:hypothetical protein